MILGLSPCYSLIWLVPFHRLNFLLQPLIFCKCSSKRRNFGWWEGNSSWADAAGKAKVLVRPNSAGGEGKAVKYFSSVTFLAHLKGFLSGNEILELKILFFPMSLLRLLHLAKSGCRSGRFPVASSVSVAAFQGFIEWWCYTPGKTDASRWFKKLQCYYFAPWWSRR